MGLDCWWMKRRLLCLKCKCSHSDFKFASDNPDFCPVLFLQPSPFRYSPFQQHKHMCYLSHYWTSAVHRLVLNLEWLSVMPSVLVAQALSWLNLYIVWGDVLYVCLLYGQLGFLYKRCTHTFNSVNVNNKTEALAWPMSFRVVPAKQWSRTRNELRI